MDLRRYLDALVAPLAPGDPLLPGVRFCGASTELGLRLSFRSAHGDLHVEVEPRVPGRPFAARTAQLLLSYRTGAKRAPLPPRLGVEVCEAVAQRVAVNEHEVLERLRAEARAAVARDEGGTRVREVAVDRLLHEAGRPHERHYTLSPYVGCLIGCRFCYAQSRVALTRRLAGLPLLPWGSFVDARINAPQVLAQELRRCEPRPIKFCPIVSDPYHALERKLRLTRRCLEVIGEAGPGWPTLVLTRSASILDDLDRLSRLSRAYVGVSLPTVDDAVRRHFEPRAASVSARLSVLAQARARGLSTFAIVQPLLPGSVEALAQALGEVVDSVRIDILRGVEGAGAQFEDPRYRDAADDDWQRQRAEQLAAALTERGVRLWPDELPPELTEGVDAPA